MARYQKNKRRPATYSIAGPIGKPFNPMTAVIGGPAIEVFMGLVDNEIAPTSAVTGFTALTGKDVVNFRPECFRLKIGGVWEIPTAAYTTAIGSIILEGSGATSAGDSAVYLGICREVEAFFGGQVPAFLVVATT